MPLWLGDWDLSKVPVSQVTKGIRRVKLSHTLKATRVAFDDPNLVSAGGLALAEAVGLRGLVDERLTVPTDKGANAGLKVSFCGAPCRRPSHLEPPCYARRTSRYERPVIGRYSRMSALRIQKTGLLKTTCGTRATWALRAWGSHPGRTSRCCHRNLGEPVNDEPVPVRCGVLVDHGHRLCRVPQTSHQVCQRRSGLCRQDRAGIAQVVELQVVPPGHGACDVPGRLDLRGTQVAPAPVMEEERLLSNLDVVRQVIGHHRHQVSLSVNTSVERLFSTMELQVGAYIGGAEPPRSFPTYPVRTSSPLRHDSHLPAPDLRRRPPAVRILHNICTTTRPICAYESPLLTTSANLFLTLSYLVRSSSTRRDAHFGSSRNRGSSPLSDTG